MAMTIVIPEEATVYTDIVRATPKEAYVRRNRCNPPANTTGAGSAATVRPSLDRAGRRPRRPMQSLSLDLDTGMHDIG